MVLESTGGCCEAIVDGLESRGGSCEAICMHFRSNIEVFESAGGIREVAVTPFAYS